MTDDAERARELLQLHRPEPDGALCHGCHTHNGKYVAADYCTTRDWALNILAADLPQPPAYLP